MAKILPILLALLPLVLATRGDMPYAPKIEAKAAPAVTAYKFNLPKEPPLYEEKTVLKSAPYPAKVAKTDFPYAPKVVPAKPLPVYGAPIEETIIPKVAVPEKPILTSYEYKIEEAPKPIAKIEEVSYPYPDKVVPTKPVPVYGVPTVVPKIAVPEKPIVTSYEYKIEEAPKPIAKIEKVSYPYAAKVVPTKPVPVYGVPTVLPKIAVPEKPIVTSYEYKIEDAPKPIAKIEEISYPYAAKVVPTKPVPVYGVPTVVPKIAVPEKPIVTSYEYKIEDAPKPVAKIEEVSYPYAAKVVPAKPVPVYGVPTVVPKITVPEKPIVTSYEYKIEDAPKPVAKIEEVSYPYAAKVVPTKPVPVYGVPAVEKVSMPEKPIVTSYEYKIEDAPKPAVKVETYQYAPKLVPITPASVYGVPTAEKVMPKVVVPQKPIVTSYEYKIEDAPKPIVPAKVYGVPTTKTEFPYHAKVVPVAPVVPAQVYGVPTLEKKIVVQKPIVTSYEYKIEDAPKPVAPAKVYGVPTTKTKFPYHAKVVPVAPVVPAQVYGVPALEKKVVVQKPIVTSYEYKIDDVPAPVVPASVYGVPTHKVKPAVPAQVYGVPSQTKVLPTKPILTSYEYKIDDVPAPKPVVPASVYGVPTLKEIPSVKPNVPAQVYGVPTHTQAKVLPAKPILTSYEYKIEDTPVVKPVVPAAVYGVPTQEKIAVKAPIAVYGVPELKKQKILAPVVTSHNYEIPETVTQKVVKPHSVYGVPA